MSALVIALAILMPVCYHLGRRHRIYDEWRASAQRDPYLPIGSRRFQ